MTTDDEFARLFNAPRFEHYCREYPEYSSTAISYVLGRNDSLALDVLQAWVDDGFLRIVDDRLRRDRGFAQRCIQALADLELTSSELSEHIGLTQGDAPTVGELFDLFRSSGDTLDLLDGGLHPYEVGSANSRRHYRYFTFGQKHMCSHPNLKGPLSDHWVEVVLPADRNDFRELFIEQFTKKYCPSPTQFAFEYDRFGDEVGAMNKDLYPHGCLCVISEHGETPF